MRNKNQTSNKLQIVLVAIVIIAIPLTVFFIQQVQVFQQRAQEGASLYLVSDTATASPKQKLTYAIYVKSNSVLVSEIGLSITYPQDKLDLIKLSTNNSPFDSQTEYLTGNGLIRFGRETLNPVAGDNYIGSLTFTAKETVSATVVTPQSQFSTVVAGATQKNILNTVSVIDKSEFQTLIKPKLSFWDSFTATISAFVTRINPF